MKEVRQLKQLQSQLKNLMADEAAMKIELANKQREYSRKLQAIEKLKKEIYNIGQQETIKVSEHAIIRYFERVKGYNIEEIEKEILNEDIVSWVGKLGGTGTYPNMGYSVIMKNNTVTTVVTP